MLIAEGARASVVRAMTAARARGATSVDTGHLLIGVLAGDDAATHGIWRQLGIDPGALRTALAVGAGSTGGDGARWRQGRAQPAAAYGTMQAVLQRPFAFTPGARGVLGDALVRAQRRHARTLGTVDLLLAIATRDRGAHRADLFAALARDAAPPVHDAVRAATRAAAHGPVQAGRHAAGRGFVRARGPVWALGREPAGDAAQAGGATSERSALSM